MYSLEVYYPGNSVAIETAHWVHAADAIHQIPLLMAQHPQCERIEVHNGSFLLFCVAAPSNKMA